MDINAEIEMVKNKIATTKSHLARIELEKKLQELIELKMKQEQKEPWEL